MTDYRTRTEVATAFLAILVLVRRQSVQAVQVDLFADIALTQGNPAEGQLADREDGFLN